MMLEELLRNSSTSTTTTATNTSNASTGSSKSRNNGGSMNAGNNNNSNQTSSTSSTMYNNNNTTLSDSIAKEMLLFIQNGDLIPIEIDRIGTSNPIAQQRFYNMYIPLLQRIFGSIIVPSSLLLTTPSTTSTTNNTTGSNTMTTSQYNQQQQRGNSVASNNGSTNTTTSGSRPSTGTPKKLTTDDLYRHMDDGWLSTDYRWRISSSFNHQHQITSNNSQPLSLDSDPVVRLLGGVLVSNSINNSNSNSNNTNRAIGNSPGSRTNNSTNLQQQQQQQQQQLEPTLLEAISYVSNINPNITFPFPLYGLSKSVQYTLLSYCKNVIILTTSTTTNNLQNQTKQIQQHIGTNPTTGSTTTENDKRLFGVLLRCGIVTQTEIMTYVQQQTVPSSSSSSFSSATTSMFSSSNYQNHQQQSSPFNSISPNNTRRSVLLTSPTTTTSSTFFFNDINNSTQQQQQQQPSTLQQQQILGKSPSIALDMVEYYLLLFIRFPLAKSGMSSTESIPGVRVYCIGDYYSASNNNNNNNNNNIPGNGQSHRQEKYGDTIYNHLFRRYLHYYLPHSSATSTSSSSSSFTDQSLGRSIDFGGGINNLITQGNNNNNNNNNNVYLNGSKPMGGIRESELFIRLIILLWFESPKRLLTTDVIVNTMKERRARTISLMMNTSVAATNGIAGNTNSSLLDLELDSSYDLVQMESIGSSNSTTGTGNTSNVPNKFESHPYQVTRCLRALVAHAIVDPAVKVLVGQTYAATNRQSKTSTSTNEDSSSNLTLDNSRWCLSSCQTTLQTSLYNYIRLSFRFASVHSSDSTFYSALNLWLLWLEPWNVTQVKRYSNPNPSSRVISNAFLDKNNYILVQKVTNPKDTDPSLFDKDPHYWEPYVAANLYMYIVPLAIFLRRSSEFDFTPNRFKRSIQTVKRVFRVFSPSLLQLIGRLVDTRKNNDNTMNQNNYSDLITMHELILGQFGPTTSIPGTTISYSLSSCKGDMQSLIEEIDTQHRKKINELDAIDRIISWIEGLFGTGVVSGEEKVLDTLMERAKLIVNVPIDYEFIRRSSTSSSIRSSDGSNDTFGSDQQQTRNPDGTLTDYGRQQLLTGQLKCNTDDIVTLQDPMRASVTSYEISFLVILSIMVSDYLNKRFDLTFDRNQMNRQQSQQHTQQQQGKAGIVRWITNRLPVLHGFRINLRFLADYRNLLFIGFIIFCWKPHWLFRFIFYLTK